MIALWIVGETVLVEDNTPIVVAGTGKRPAPCIEGRKPGGVMMTARQAVDLSVWGPDAAVYVKFPGGCWWLADIL